MTSEVRSTSSDRHSRDASSLPQTSSSKPGTADSDIPDREHELKNIKDKLRRVLLNGLPLIGAEAINLKSDEKRAHVVESGDHTLDGTTKHKRFIGSGPSINFGLNIGSPYWPTGPT